MQTLDVRQDGEIDYDEFVASVAAEQSKLTDAKLQAAFDYIDSDKDGVVSRGQAANPESHTLKMRLLHGA